MSTPFYGVLRLAALLKLFGYPVNVKRVRRLMKLVNWRTIFREPKTTISEKTHYKYPYLLRNLEIVRCNQVWAMDITYIPMKKGFMYLTAIIDLYSRFVIHWSISNTMTAEWCTDVLKESIEKHGKPEIFNTDQGSQFTSEAFTDILRSHDISISMDCKGRWMDNVFIERLWKSLKYEDIYLKAYNSMKELKKGLTDCFQFYNEKRWHNTFDRKTPAMVYCESLPQGQAAA